MSKPILFVDIDGTLNSPFTKSENPIPLLLDPDQLDPAAKNLCLSASRTFSKDSMEYLSMLQKMFDASIVISSSWRSVLPLDRLQTLFTCLGVQGVDDVTGPGVVRSDCIKNYLTAHPGRPWIVLDDMNLGVPCGMHYINCKGGFHQAQFEQSVRSLLAQKARTAEQKSDAQEPFSACSDRRNAL